MIKIAHEAPKSIFSKIEKFTDYSYALVHLFEEDQEYLFSRFFRAHNATNIPGTGLGLNIVKKYLDLLRGRIEFISNQDGTIFTVQVPL